MLLSIDCWTQNIKLEMTKLKMTSKYKLENIKILKNIYFKILNSTKLEMTSKAEKSMTTTNRGRVVSLQGFEHFEVISMVNNKRDHKNM